MTEQSRRHRNAEELRGRTESPCTPLASTATQVRGLPESCEQLKPVSPVLLLCPRGCPPAMSAVRCGDRPRSERQSRQ